jgi:cyclic AMP-dependent transcription factor ATF-4
MEEDEIGLLESSSDLQAFINMASLPEIQGDEDVDVEKVITDVTGFLQNYDTTSNCHKQQKLALNYDLMSNDEDSKEETAAAVDILDELLKYNDITEEEFAPALSSEDLPPEEMAAAEDILDELLKSGNMSLDDFDLSSEDPLKEEQVEATTIETLKEDPNDSGFIDITNAQHITIDGQDIFIVVAPPSPQHQQEELVTSVTAPESLATLSPAHPLAQSDSDWTPDSPKASKGRPPVKRTSLKAKSSRKNQVGTPFIKDKKERKKHQNVEAARRYRDKKKSEQENVESEEQALADKNKGLKSEVSDLEVKVRTMKQLMVELGILKQA